MAVPIAPPSNHVLRAFGVRGPVRPLAGGQGHAFVVDDAVLKQADDPDEAAWVQDLASRLDPTGFRLAPPIAASDGAWVHDSWTACELLPGLVAAAPDWEAIIAAGRCFVEATDEVSGLATDVLGRRTSRWARADRCAWGEEDVELAAPAQRLLTSFAELTGVGNDERRIVHADLTGNVHLDRDGRPVILDISPYLRPLRWSEAVVVADAVTWWGGSLDVATAFVATDGGLDLLARALIFRLVAEQLGELPAEPSTLTPYERVLAHLTR